MSKVVSVRIEKSNIKKTKNQLAHDIRFKAPSYLRRDDANRLCFYKNDSLTLFEFTKNTSILSVANNYLANQLEDIQTKIQDDYKTHHKKKLSVLTKEFLTGVITFGVDDEQKSLRDDALVENLSLTDNEVQEINKTSKSSLDKAAYDFLQKFSKKYGSKILYLVRHDDEKTTHYHFVATHYNFNTHKTITSNYTHKDITSIGSDLQDMVADSFAQLGFVRGKKAIDKKKHLKVVDMHKKEQEELLEANKQYKLKLQELKSTQLNLVNKLKQLRADITTSDLDISLKKEQYELITTKQKEARATAKLLQEEIKSLKNNKTTLSTTNQELNKKLQNIAISTISQTTKRFMGQTIVSDTKKLQNKILKDLQTISKLNIHIKENQELKNEIITKDETIQELEAQLQTTKEKLSQAMEVVNNSDIVTKAYNDIKTKLQTANETIKSKDTTIKELQNDIQELEKTYKFNYQEFKANRKSKYEKLKELKNKINNQEDNSGEFGSVIFVFM